MIHQTTDHGHIKEWIERRGGQPAMAVMGIDTGPESVGGDLAIDFGENDNNVDLEEITWELFFRLFEEKRLAFAHEEDATDSSRFYQFFSRDTLFTS
jgi:hypothetical protein